MADRADRALGARGLRAAFLAVLLLGSAGCSSQLNPATGERNFTSVSPQQEAQIGDQQHPRVLAEYGGAYTEDGTQAYVEEIGQSLAAVSETPDADFTFTLLDSPVVNAFALPGGYVYVSRGLLALAEDEAELAGVLGHEIGHVTARHTAQRLTRAQGAQFGVVGATILGAILGGQAGAELAQQAGGFGATAYIQGYSRDQEFQADQLGIRYLERTDYDPVAMSTFLGSMTLYEQLQAAATGTDVSSAPSWLASHPRTPDRIERAAEEASAELGGTERNRDRYLEAIDGLIWGDDPAGGVVEGRTFVHPELGFAFTAPPGFRLQNTPEAVLGQDRSGRAMIFNMGSGSGSAADYIRGTWLQGARILALEEVEINGEEAARARAVVDANGRQAEADVYAIPSGEGGFWRFVFVADGSVGGAEEQAFLEAARSFRDLSASEAGDYPVMRIRIHTVRSGETVDSLAAQMEVPELKRETFLTINRLAADGVEPGDKVKLIASE